MIRKGKKDPFHCCVGQMMQVICQDHCYILVDHFGADPLPYTKIPHEKSLQFSSTWVKKGLVHGWK